MPHERTAGLRQVCKRFSRGGLFSSRRVAAVKDVSFSVAPDRPEIFTIIGESGSGKSTLARMILGIYTPTSGELLLGGQSVADRGAPTARLHGEVQPIFQNPFEAFNPLKQLDRYLFLTAHRFGGANVGCRRQKRQADEALRQVGLSLAEIRGRFPHELSGGQLQRMAIARALLAKPR